MSAQVLAVPTDFPPSIDEFFPPPLVEGVEWLTRITVLVWISVAFILLFFLIAYRNPRMVPTRMQWMAESIYGFSRNNIARDTIGPEGVKFAPYFATLLSFILVMNLFGIIPGIQISPNTHFMYPVILAIISWVLFMVVGFQRHGIKYFKVALIPNAPLFILPLLILIEFFSTFIVRPVTLSLRLFANMFAGHMILAVFSLGGFALLNAGSVFIKPISVLSWALAIALTFLEALVVILQAYVFVILTSSYVAGALAEEH